MARGAIATLFIQLEGSIAKFAGQMGKAADHLDKFGAKARNVGAKMSALSVPVGAAAGAALKMAGDFEASMNKVSARGNIFGEQLKGLEDLALKLGAATQFSAKEAADGMADLAAAGFDANKIAAAMPGVLDFAAASQLSVAEASLITVDTLGQFNMQADQAGRVADVMAAAANASQISMQDLALSMKYVGPVANAVGISLEDASAMLALFGEAGIRADTAGTSFRMGLKRLIAPPKAAAEALEALGISATDSAGKLRPLPELLDEFKSHASDPKFTAYMAKIFGAEAMPAWVAAVGKGGDALLKYQEITRNSAGQSQRMAEILRGGLNGAIEKARGSVETMGIALGRIMAPAATVVAGVIEKLANVVTSLAVAFNGAPEWMQYTASALVGLTVVVGPLTFALGLMVQGFSAFMAVAGKVTLLLPMLSKGFAIAMGGLKLFGGALALLLTPIGATIAAVAALATAAYLIYDNWDTVGPWLLKEWNLVKLGFTTIVNAIKGEWDAFWHDVGVGFDFLKQKWTEFWTDVQRGAEVVKQTIIDMKNWVVQSFNEMVESVTGMVTKIKSEIEGRLVGAFDSVKEGVQGMLDWFKWGADEAVGHSIIPDMIDMIAEQMQRLNGDAMVTPTRDATRATIDELGNLETKVESSTARMKESFEGLSDGVAALAEALGVSSEYASQLGDVVQGIFSGQAGGSGASQFGAMIGNWFRGGTETDRMHAAGVSGPGMADGSWGGAGAGGASGTGGGINAGGYATYFQAAAEGLKEWDAAAARYQGQHNEKRKQIMDSIHATGMVVANAWTFGLASVVEKFVGRENMEKLSIGKHIVHALFGENVETWARHQFANFVEERFSQIGQLMFYDAQGKLQTMRGDKFNFLEGDKGRFNPGGDVGGTNWADNFKAMGEETMVHFTGLGMAFKELLGITEDIAPQIGYLIATNLSGNLDNARLFVQQLGVSQEEMMKALENAALQGNMSWHEYNVAVASVTEAYKEGLVAHGAYAQAFENLRESGGRGMAAVANFRNIAIEAMEDGVKTFEELKARMIASGADPAEVEALFAAAAQRGVTTLEGWRDASNATAGAIVGDMYAISGSLREKWDEMKDTLNDVYQTINELPDKVEKTISVNVEVNDPDGGLERIEESKNSTTTQPNVKAATGGVLKGGAMFAHKGGLGLMGEAGPEAILPLGRVGGKLGVMAGGDSAGRNFTVVVNAPNSDIGAADHIRRTILDMKDFIIEEAVETMYEETRRRGFGR